MLIKTALHTSIFMRETIQAVYKLSSHLIPTRETKKPHEYFNKNQHMFLRSWSAKSRTVLQTFIRDKSVSNIYCKEKLKYICPINFFCIFYSVWDKYTRVSQMKTLNIFLNTIYCAEVVQSCITFQHNLPHAQCKSSSAYKVHKFL